jgi:hypothetical protein
MHHHPPPAAQRRAKAGGFPQREKPRISKKIFAAKELKDLKEKRLASPLD